VKPFIGITTGGRHEHKVISKYYDEYEHVAALYVDAVRLAGGVPLLLPPGDDWRDALDAVDGVIVTGGVDVHPAHYGGDAHHPHVKALAPERDTSELALARHLAGESNLPALFICRGLQVLNVALGGTLHEHIPDVRETDMHRSADGTWTRHAVQVEERSQLADAMGAAHVETYSGHHQAVKQIGDGLRVTATAPDGIIEGLEQPGRAGMIAVQWHPEKSAVTDPTQRRLFGWLAYQAVQHRARRGDVA
jgi:putative glutamine amidotransferase